MKRYGMKILIYGAGTIGLTYAWLLSSSHNVTVLVKPEKVTEAQNGYKFTVHDLREKKPAAWIPKTLSRRACFAIRRLLLLLQ